MRAKARCFLTCSRLIRADVCPRAFFCTVTVRDCIGRMSDVLLMHRHGAVVSGFLVCLSGILIMHRLGATASRLAGAVREKGSLSLTDSADLRISPYLSNTSQRNHACVVHRLQRFPGVMGWSPEDASLGAPARSNKIYTYDVVFPIGETNINASSKTPPTLSPIKKSNPQRKFPNKFGSGIHLAERRTNVRALPCRERDKSRSNASLTECFQNIRQISFDFRHAVCYNTIFKEDSIE